MNSLEPLPSCAIYAHEKNQLNRNWYVLNPVPQTVFLQTIFQGLGTLRQKAKIW